MMKTLTVTFLAVLVSFSAQAKQSCLEINGNFSNLEKASTVSTVSIKSVPNGDSMIYALVGLAEGVFYADGKARQIKSLGGSSATTVCTKTGFIVKIEDSKNRLNSGELHVNVINDRGDLTAEIKTNRGNLLNAVLIKAASETGACQK